MATDADLPSMDRGLRAFWIATAKWTSPADQCLFAQLSKLMKVYILSKLMKVFDKRSGGAIGRAFSRRTGATQSGLREVVSSDFWIVVFNIGDFVMPFVLQNVHGFNGAAIFRLLRIFRAVRAIRALRVLRTIRFLSNLQVILTTVLQSIKSIGTVVMLISLFMYMFAVIGRGLYADADPAHFGNLFYALFTLFQLLTLDDWFDVYLTVTRNDSEKGHVILFLIIYIVVEYFIFLNLFVAVLVDNFQLTLEAQNVANAAAKRMENESDDDDDGPHVTASTESSISTGELDIVKRRKTIQDYYSDMPKKDRDDLRHYFQILASLDHNQYMLANQHRVLDMMVLMCAEDATISD
ncbi:Cation channel sperm-associated protein 1 [Lamellibrachia satsuma]|nr:Cation channel sperm-associated protein 1 [Lamellibrachia satsuma]